ncbi:MmcQ/YjbR family DNA-binding protein [Herbaspirillum sp. GCM10030257]|uniref:MmcQ/YjbR family DNA-binding protein n=1 Tax=Herbaspirillum sp. GCM10030257 TaxID=3273393 RepID=UPI0036203490
MVNAADIRRCALALPEVQETIHFRLPAFKVGEKIFAMVQSGDTHAILSVSEEQAKAAEDVDPRLCQVVRRNGGKIFVGVRVELSHADESHVKQLVEQAWMHKAPKRISAGRQ